MIGERYGRLVVLKRWAREGGPDRLLVRCDCGAEKEVCARSVKRGRTKSCGCLLRERATRHGLSRHPEYIRWRGIIDRCYRPGSPSYPNYGARGIGVCDEWKRSPASFVKWAIKNGAGADKQIDRIDNDGNYSPENCRFVTVSENARRTRRNKTFVFLGDEMTIAEASEKFEVPYDTLCQRIHKLKWSPDRAVTQPVRKIRTRAA